MLKLFHILNIERNTYMDTKEKYHILYKAYEHYQKTGDRHFDITLYNSNYLSSILITFQELKDNGYIENVSNKLLIAEQDSPFIPFSVSPSEPLSFDITSRGIRFVSDSKL